METYHKINGLYKRHTDGPKKGKFIMGDWANPEIGYLRNNEWEFTEKVDGTNIRIGFSLVGDSLHVEFGGRTDNADLPKPLLARLREMFPDSPSGSGENFRVGRWMIDNDITEAILFGEGYGPKIQAGGGNYGTRQDFVLFDVKVGDWWLSRENVNDVAKTLEIASVPVLGTGTLQDAIDIVSTGITFNPLQHWGGSIIKGLKSQWGDFEAEGIVARPLVPMFDRKGQRIITKIKAVDFR